MMGPDIRNEIDVRLAAGEWQAARALLVELCGDDASAATASFACARFERLREQVRFTPYRLAILRSFTVEPLVPLLRAMAFSAGIDLCVRVGDFNAYAQEILDPGSWLQPFAPQGVILAVQTSEAAPELLSRYAELEPGEAAAAVARVETQFGQWIRALRRRSQASVIVHSLEMPCDPANGVFDIQSEYGQADAITDINRRLRQIARELPGVYILDYDALVARYGRVQWRDERKWQTVRLPIGAAHLANLAREWMRFVQPVAGRAAKAIVVDLDNTVWGGVIGEDGIGGIKVGAEHPGATYQAIQRALLDLRRRGIMLAVASKNNPADALEALENHPGMLLRPAHFSALRINWNDKPQSLREIAEELNIGIDALAFVDDNPAERQRVRAALPEVTVVELPSDPGSWARAIRTHPAFERLAVVDEDRQRADYYAAARERKRLEEAVPTREHYLRSLEQVAEIERLNAATIARVAQLTQKTNQFNLTTRRYTEQQLAEIIACGNWHIFSLRVRDRYGDNGIVGVAILARRGPTCEIDTLLLSCRVIGRDVETAFLSWLAAWSRDSGARSLEGWFLPTRKNAPASDFYPRHGFRQVSESAEGSLWSLDLAASALTCPEWIKLQIIQEAKA